MSREVRQYEDFTVTLDVDKEGYTYVHLDVRTWSKSSLKHMKQLFEEEREKLRARGKPLLYFYLPKNKSLKFHNMIRPVDYTMLCGDQQEMILGAWSTE